MAPADTVQRVRIYLSRDDQWEGGPRYLALLEQLRRAGATGATALQGLAGFGPGQRARPAIADRTDQHQPIVVEWIDREERVARLLPLLDTLIGEALVTLETVPVYQATLRARGPFTPDRSVGEVMRRPAPAVAAGTPLAEALDLLVDEHLDALPVVDEAGRLIGMITGQDLIWRVGLRLPPALLPSLSADERTAALAPLAGHAARDVMSAEPRSVGLSTTIPQALVTMVEWGYTQIPVVEHDGRLAGLLGQEHVLREAVAQAMATPDEGAVRDAEPPTPVRLVMQTAAHYVAASARLNLALAHLLATPERRLLVLDDNGRLVGALDDATALRGLAGAERASFLKALQSPRPTPTTALPGEERGLAGLFVVDPPAIDPQSSVLDAARRLLELGVERLAVIDDEQKLSGIIARGGLIRALMQQSE
ncbi:MAG: CBS domain-containing protein [Chloroflexales bacterium]|nr:CBS domain-containing protein [Chloroflexales bacterium]